MASQPRPGRTLALGVLGCVAATTLLVKIAPGLEQIYGRLLVGGVFGAWLFTAFLACYRWLLEACNNRVSSASVDAWQPISDAASRDFKTFRILLRPWMLQFTLVAAIVVLPAMIATTLAFEKISLLPVAQQREMGLILASFLALSAVFLAALYVLNRRVIHLHIGAHDCSFRLAGADGANLHTIAWTHSGSFPMDRIASLWSREHKSAFLGWKIVRHGVTFKAGDHLQLGSTNRVALTQLGALDWERVLAELSRRSGVAISH